MTAPLFTQAEITRAKMTLKLLSDDWTGEVPYRLHESAHGDHFGLGSAPPFAPEFIGYIGRMSCKNEHCTRCRREETRAPRDSYAERKNNHRVRTTRAFRKLRRHAPIEYDVLWMAVMYHYTIAQITTNLNDRAITKGYPDRYTPADVAILAVSGIDKVARWF